MKRLLPLAILVVVFVVVGQYYRSSHGPEKAYKAFAEEILHRRYVEAAAMSEGLTASDLEKQGSQERIGPGPAMFQALYPSLFAIESQETGPDGAVVIKAVQTVRFTPAGVESAIRPAMTATLRQVVTLKKGDAGWKVTAFENTFEKMDSIGR
jgi:hypothetical protein